MFVELKGAVQAEATALPLHKRSFVLWGGGPSSGMPLILI